MSVRLRRVGAADLPRARIDPLDDATLEGAGRIVEDVRQRGWEAVVEHAERLGDRPDEREGSDREMPWILDRSALSGAFDALPTDTQMVLQRTADRIRRFASAQRAALSDVRLAVPGGEVGHTVIPVARAGCYAPGGRYPLPSSVLMTAVTARAAGVREVWVASPRPSRVTIGAAYVAGADALLAVGGAQAIAALAFGAGEVPACDAIVGPGNRWVTAAKQKVAGRVAIDMLAGPSELCVLADESADPTLIAADLLAQAEHDPDSLPVLVATSAELVDRVDSALSAQIADLPTAEVARAALANGMAVIEADEARACAFVDALAPEHLQIVHANASGIAAKIRNAGALFLGEGSAEVLGDYGIGPNHVLPTSRAARSRAGLSVLTFLRARTWIALDAPIAAEAMCRDAAALARLEGLEAHARAAEMRIAKRSAGDADADADAGDTRGWRGGR